MTKDSLSAYLLLITPNILLPLKRSVFRNAIQNCGNNLRGMYNVKVDNPSRIEIGENFFAAENLYLSATEGITIGDNVLFGPDVMLIGGNHKISVPGKLINEQKGGDKLLPIVIEDDVWVGARTIILSGVHVGKGSVIGAGSVVTKSIPEFWICTGVPCSPIKPRFKSLQELERHVEHRKINLRMDTYESYKEYYGVSEQQ